MTKTAATFLLSLTLLPFLIGCRQAPPPQRGPEYLPPDSAAYDTLGTGQMSYYRIPLQTGAEVLMADSLQLLQGKRVAIAANHTAVFRNGRHLVDSLRSRGVQVVKIFTPEHGFRGDADAGAKVANTTDLQSGLPIISLYGDNKKPTAAQLAAVDMVIFDMQDVGTRHYTYVSTMSYMLEACAGLGIPFMVLDRPNPNGWYVEGPLMQKDYQSFIGMHPVPIVHGMTLGEYASMALGEGWISVKAGASVLRVMPMRGYTHRMKWQDTGLPWVPPSPNLGTPQAAALYPALCWLEATAVSEGRGTDSAFSLAGAPWAPMPDSAETRHGLRWIPQHFTPRSIPGKATKPRYLGQRCFGYRFEGQPEGRALFLSGLELLAHFYAAHKTRPAPREDFFMPAFEKWAGYAGLRGQITRALPAEEIYDSWQPDLQVFKEFRKRYLLYP